jgi:hypothetical protein
MSNPFTIWLNVFTHDPLKHIKENDLRDMLKETNFDSWHDA